MDWLFLFADFTAGSAGSLTTLVEDKGDHWELNGVKNFITNGKEAKLAIVFAKTEKTVITRGCRLLSLSVKARALMFKNVNKLGIKGPQQLKLL